jgi:hypothetical protein
MPLFVDHAGMNTLVSQDLDLETNTLTGVTRARQQLTPNLTYSIQFPATTSIPDKLTGTTAGYSSIGQFSFSFWIKLDQDHENNNSYIFMISKSDNQAVYGLRSIIDNNVFYFEVQNDSFVSQRWGWNIDISQFKSGFRNVTLSWLGSYEQVPDVYVDGQPLGINSYVLNSALSGEADWRLPQEITIGGPRRSDQAFNDLGGRLSHFAIWNSTLTATQAGELYNSGVPLDTMINGSNLLDFWKLGEESSINSLNPGDKIAASTVITSTSGSSGTNLVATSGYDGIFKQPGVGFVSDSAFTHEGFVGVLDAGDRLVGLNTHRNGPYGFSSWKQLRASDNPLTRNHIKNNKFSFVTQPGSVRNVLTEGELRVVDRYSPLRSFIEPPVCQKSHPLIWNVGRHFKDEDGNVDMKNPNRFSIISSFDNQLIGFSRESMNKLLKFDPKEEKTEYIAIKDMYLENGLNKLDSPLTYWEFLQYRETLFPKPQQQFVDQARTRPEFSSYYRHRREDRDQDISSTRSFFGFTDPSNFGAKMSTWPLDASTNFLTETQTNPDNINPFSLSGSLKRSFGVLQSFATQYIKDLDTFNSKINNANIDVVRTAIAELDKQAIPLPMYSRRSWATEYKRYTNPSGIAMVQTESVSAGFLGSALWEAGTQRHLRNEDGSFTRAEKYPFYDTYENYVEDVKKYSKNYSVLPEFRMSSQIEDYIRTDGLIEKDMFEVIGGISGSENSSKDNFFEIYSNTDFMKSFEIVASDHEEFTNGKVLSLRCKAVKKFLPYEGFYPCQRTVDLADRFYNSYKNGIKLYNGNGVEIDGFNLGRQMVMGPLFAPGVLFNSIKSGIAVDYPILTSSVISNEGIENASFDKRIPFEAIVEPKKYLSNFNVVSNETHPSGNLSSSAFWDGSGDELYSLMANNFIAEIPEFFLPNGQLTSVVSKRQRDIGIFKKGKVYGMRIKMRRSMDKSRPSVYHSGKQGNPYFPPQDIILTGSSACRETFTMYSSPSAFGPASLGINDFSNSSIVHYDQDRADTGSTQVVKSSREGYNFPFTPPYYHGEAWCDVWLTGSGVELTIEQIQASITSSFSRFDSSYYTSNGSSITDGEGPQSFYENRVNQNANQLSSSLNIFGIGSVREEDLNGEGGGSFVVDTGQQENNRWVIQTKFETPMLNFAYLTGSDYISLPNDNPGPVPRGIWHQYGRIPESNEGVFLEVSEIPQNYQKVVMLAQERMEDLSEHLGFSGVGTKLGRIRKEKEISEAIVAVPFVEKQGRKKFFGLEREKVRLYKERNLEALYDGPPDTQIGRSVRQQLDKMQKFVFPPSFDFLSSDGVPPIAMYIFEFAHTLTQQDLSDIWQNLPPDIGNEMEVSEIAITHPLLKKELLGPGGRSGNSTIEIPDRLKWMVFKVKQRASSNYFKKTVLRNRDLNSDVESVNATSDEFGQTSNIQYNWPYDFFSLVEMAQIDAEVELGNIDFSNYTDTIPPWNAVVADEEKIEFVVGGLEDDPIPETTVPKEPRQKEPEVNTEVEVVIVWQPIYEETIDAVISVAGGLETFRNLSQTKKAEAYREGAFPLVDPVDGKYAYEYNNSSELKRALSDWYNQNVNTDISNQTPIPDGSDDTETAEIPTVSTDDIFNEFSVSVYTQAGVWYGPGAENLLSTLEDWKTLTKVFRMEAFSTVKSEYFGASGKYNTEWQNSGTGTGSLRARINAFYEVFVNKDYPPSESSSSNNNNNAGGGSTIADYRVTSAVNQFALPGMKQKARRRFRNMVSYHYEQYDINPYHMAALNQVGIKFGLGDLDNFINDEQSAPARKAYQNFVNSVI